MAQYTYLLLAVDLFAITALLLGFITFAGVNRYERLFPLLFLVVVRSLALVISLTAIEQAREIINTLEILSVLAVVWALIGPIPKTIPVFGSASRVLSHWQEFLGVGVALGIFFALLPLLPFWPIPPQIHSVIIAMTGTVIIFLAQGEARWTHLAPPILLGAANIFALPDVELMGLAWLLMLLAYAVFIVAIHWEGVRTYQEATQFLRDRQLEVDDLAAEVANQNRERLRLLEACEMMSNVPSLGQAMDHIVSSMAGVTHVDQAAILMLDVKAIGLAHVVSVYSPERPVHITSRDKMVFELEEYPTLRKAIENQQQMLLPAENVNGLHQLYGLWSEDRTGPTLIQPLAVQGRAVGALMLGNPVTQRPINPPDAVLCQSLASHIAIVLEYRRRYLELELQAEAMAIMVQQQISRPVQAYADSPEPVVETIPEPEIIPASDLEPDLPEESIVEIAPEPEVIPDLAPPEEPILEMVDDAPIHALAEAMSPINEDSLSIDDLLTFDDEKYLAIFDAISEGVILSDHTGRVQLVNKAAERILGRARHQLKGQPIGAVYGQIDSSESIENLAVAFSRRNQPLPTFIEDDNRSIQGRLIPWRNDHNEWMGIIGVFRDVTREVKADEARNDFITALSHELRAPLTMVKGYSELITSSRMGDYTPDQVRIQRIIFSNSERMVEVLDNAIKLTTTDKHRFVVKFEEVDVKKVIENACREIRPLAEGRKLELICDIKTDLPLIEADRRHLLRILDNLLSNACRFTPRGGRVTLRAWTESAAAKEGTGDRLFISVADNGVGIPKRETKKIFQPFYQVEGQKLDEKPGMGIGLTVVKELIELHKGDLQVESTEGVGSMFEVNLPISQEF